MHKLTTNKSTNRLKLYESMNKHENLNHQTLTKENPDKEKITNGRINKTVDNSYAATREKAEQTASGRFQIL